MRSEEHGKMSAARLSFATLFFPVNCENPARRRTRNPKGKKSAKVIFKSSISWRMLNNKSDGTTTTVVQCPNSVRLAPCPDDRKNCYYSLPFTLPGGIDEKFKKLNFNSFHQTRPVFTDLWLYCLFDFNFSSPVCEFHFSFLHIFLNSSRREPAETNKCSRRQKLKFFAVRRQTENFIVCRPWTFRWKFEVFPLK